MLYFAYHRDEYLISDASLDAVLAFIADCQDLTAPEDAVVWQAGRVVAVCRGDGTVIRFDGAPPAPPAAPQLPPPDLALIDEAAA